MVSLAKPEQHIVHVQVQIPAGAAEHDLQLPVWNALYQVRDFSQYVLGMQARTPAGQVLPVQSVDKSRWHIAGADKGAVVSYEIYANQPGPYNAQLNAHHAFFNLAEILIYAVDLRSSLVGVRFVDSPADWKVATTLLTSIGLWFEAPNYDQLVDAPVEISNFQEASFDERGSRYRVVVDGDPSDYDMQKIVSIDHSIVAAAVSWMDDSPFPGYTFYYHFPRGNAGGGMEHAFSTAIDLSAPVLRNEPMALPNVTAHEFFHLWNVKRIRPQSLEPVDYTRENYTRALWFSEGVTSTVEAYILLRAGLLDERHFLDRVAEAIAELERRPAHATQSAEEASLDAWLEKYPLYRRPERSISYYNKGELLGFMLDLQMREASHGSASLRELFHWMNENYAKQNKFFADSQGVRQAAEAVTHADLAPFFEKYVAGKEEIPWNEFFATVGLRLDKSESQAGDPGITAVPEFGKSPSIATVAPGSEAERAGVHAGDTLLQINGRSAASDPDEQLNSIKPGDTISVRLRNTDGEREVQWKAGTRSLLDYTLRDMESISPAQRDRRSAWLKGESQGAARP